MNFGQRVTEPDRSNKPNALVRRLSVLGNLGSGDVVVLENLQAKRVRFKRGAQIVEIGSKYDSAFALCDGWAYRSQNLSDGRRQILGYVLPGDFIALHVNFPRTADHSVIAMTEIEVAVLPVEKIEDIYRNYPNVAIALSYSTAQDHTILGGQITRLGRRAADERLAHLILELWQRLKLVGIADDDGFELPVTQQHLADMLGLTAESISRTFRKLEQSGIIARARHRIRIVDFDGLKTAAEFDPLVQIGFSPIAGNSPYGSSS